MLQLLKGRLTRLGVFESPYLPELFSHELFMGIAQHILQKWVHVIYLASLCVEDQDSILGCFKKPTVTSLGGFKRFLCLLDPHH
jgi:hypothetical protein